MGHSKQRKQLFTVSSQRNSELIPGGQEHLDVLLVPVLQRLYTNKTQSGLHMHTLRGPPPWSPCMFYHPHPYGGETLSVSAFSTCFLSAEKVINCFAGHLSDILELFN